MKPLRGVLSGLLTVIAVSLVVLGAFSAALAEGRLSAPEAPTPTTQPTLENTAVVHASAAVPEATATAVKTSTPTVPVSTTCPAPAGWQPYTIQYGDDLPGLAAARMVSEADIIQGNCLVSTTLLPGTYLYLPPAIPTMTLAFTQTITPTRTPVPCGPPPGWINYTVQAGDTLFKLSRDFGVSVAELQFANCLGSSTLIITGQRIKVPNVPTRTPSPTDRPENTRTPTPVTPTAVTPTPVTPTAVTPTEVSPTPVTPTAVTPTDDTPTPVTPTVDLTPAVSLTP